MTRRELMGLSKSALLEHAQERFRHENATIAEVVNALAEIDARRLYVEMAYPSLRAFCTDWLGMSEDVASKRIQVVRIADQFPAIVTMLANGRLSLSGAVLLAPHLRPENADELLAAAANRTKAQIELLIAERFPRADLMSLVQPVASESRSGMQGHACESREQHAPGHVMSSPHGKVAPLSPLRFGVQFTIDEATHELLCFAQGLLGNAVPPGDIGEVFVRALKAYAEQLEKQRFGTGSRSRKRGGSSNSRYIALAVRGAVWKRDGGQCAFTSHSGRRCEATRALEFDHVIPVARGGESTADNLRLLCRAHNQHVANRVLGERFMEGRREGAVERRAEERRQQEVLSAAAATTEVAAPDECSEQAPVTECDPTLAASTTPAAHPDVALCLKSLGFRASEIREAMLRCRSVASLPPEEQVRFALKGMGPRCARTVRMEGSPEQFGVRWSMASSRADERAAIAVAGPCA